MNHEDVFKSALVEAKEESYEALKEEIVSMEQAIERFLSSVLECSSNICDQDYYTSNF